MKLDQAFFARLSEEVARDLIGRTLVRVKGALQTKLIITKVVAHQGGKATPARQGMNYAPGTIFVMPYRGGSFLNIATDAEGRMSCVCIHGGVLEGDGGIFDRPIKLANRLGVTAGLDGKLLGTELWVEGDGVDAGQVERSRPKDAADNVVAIFSRKG